MRLVFLIGTALASALAPTAASAQADICTRLWIERNTIFKANGYCFKTPRAIRMFGNAGCSYDDERSLQLTQGERARVRHIVQQERSYGC